MLEKILTWIITVCGFGLVTWTVRYWIAKVSDKQDELEKKLQRAMQGDAEAIKLMKQ